MKSCNNSPFKSSGYGAGALIVLVASLGAAAIVYSLILPLDIFSLPAWIFGPLGIYTLAYPLIARKDTTYYLVWGCIMVTIALASGLYTLVSPLVILGILAIVMAIMGIFAYQRSKK